MSVRRVFIAWSHPLFHGSVRLLLNHPAVEIVGSSPETDIVWADVIQLQPDAIIIERDDDGETAVCAATLHIWEHGAWNPPIIHVGLQDNTVQVYRREQHLLEQSEDLLHLVLNE